jgi:hypothetical protein
LNKIVSIKETSAIFLAIVLVLGTIALTVPSFSVEAQATSDREKDYDNDYEDKKSYDKDDYKSEYSSYGKYYRDHDKSEKDSKSVSIKKVKCNNINVNLNGIDVNIGGLPNNGPVTEPIAVAQEEEDDDDETESNSIENDNNESYEHKDGKSDANTNSKIICINNNNNIVVAEEEPETCEECFTTVLDEEELDDLIQAITVDSLGTVSSLGELCDFIDEISDIIEERAFISDRLFVLGGDVGISEDEINEILDCLEKVFGEEFPREIIIDSLTVQQHMNWKS